MPDWKMVTGELAMRYSDLEVTAEEDELFNQLLIKEKHVCNLNQCQPITPGQSDQSTQRPDSVDIYQHTSQG